jgi:hypothetical protein
MLFLQTAFAAMLRSPQSYRIYGVAIIGIGACIFISFNTKLSVTFASYKDSSQLS